MNTAIVRLAAVGLLIGAPLAHSAALVRATGQRFDTVQAAVDALPETGGEITLEPGVYREKLSIAKRGVWLHGAGSPREAVIVWGDSSASVGGTIKSASVTVTADNFRAENLTIQNDWSLHGTQQSQAVALSVSGDRAVFRRVRLLGAQDTLHTGGRCQETGACRVSRQYFRDCYIEGHVDFIFGDSNAFFDRCEIHAIAADEVMLTAHRDETPDFDRAYVFDRCRVTADRDARKVWLGRPWRDYARTIFMNTHMDARVEPAGWREWTPGETNRLTTAYYAEYRSSGRGARPKQRDAHAHQLTRAQAAQWMADTFLRGTDGWAPHKDR